MHNINQSHTKSQSFVIGRKEFGS